MANLYSEADFIECITGKAQVSAALKLFMPPESYVPIREGLEQELTQIEARLKELELLDLIQGKPNDSNDETA